MNIFMLDEKPKLSAQYHNDKHVVKMIVEYAQLLSTAHRVLDGTSQKVNYVTKTGKPRTKTVYVLDDNDGIYEAAHVNHPSAVWVRESENNYLWLHEMSVYLCREYSVRYDKIHKSQSVIAKLSNLPKNIVSAGKTKLPLAMPEEYHQENPVEAYRAFYRDGKSHIANWKTVVPWWF